MPPINPVISAGVIALSVAVVAAIVVYENPEVRRMADDLKRRVAVAVQNIGDNMAPDGPAAARRRRRNSEEAAAADGSDEPLFNRPEDAEGFLMSRGGLADGDSAGVVADEETRRRQREELMYWNRLQMQRQKQEEQASRSSNSNSNSNNTRWQPRDALEAMQRVTRDAAAAAGIRISPLGGGQPTSSRVSISFDQLLRPDTSAADRGTYVINTDEATGTTSSSNANIGESLLRHRRPEAAAAAAAAAIAVHSQATAYANPFSDEYGIELDEDLEEQRQQLRAYEEAHALSRAQQASSNVSANANANANANVSSFDRDDIMSDIYSATEPDTNAAVTENNKIDAVFDPLPAIAEQQQQQQQQTVPGSVSNASQSDVIFDANDYSTPTETLGRASASVTTDNDSHASELLQQLQNAVALNDSYVNAGQQQQQEEEEDSASAVNAEAFNSIQAWAQDSSSASLAGFYSPLPVTPNTAMSEPSVISSGGDGDGDGDGQMTPTESMSIIGSAAGDYDVASEDESEGVMTPTSWSEVGSVVSESESSMHA